MAVAESADLRPALARLGRQLELRQGLADAMGLPVHRLVLDLLGGVSSVGGPWARAEAEYRLTPSSGVYGGAGWDRDSGAGLFAGYRVEL